MKRYKRSYAPNLNVRWGEPRFDALSNNDRSSYITRGVRVTFSISNMITGNLRCLPILNWTPICRAASRIFIRSISKVLPIGERQLPLERISLPILNTFLFSLISLVVSWTNNLTFIHPVRFWRTLSTARKSHISIPKTKTSRRRRPKSMVPKKPL